MVAKQEMRRLAILALFAGIVFVLLGLRREAKPSRLGAGGESKGQRHERQGNAGPASRSVLDLSRSRPQSFDGIPTGLLHQMKSPYVYDGPSIDVEGLAVGAKVACPTTGKILTVPKEMVRLAVEAKLDRIVIPELQLIGQTLPEAVAYLRDQSVALDPDGVGVAMRIDADRIERLSPGVMADACVSLILGDLPLPEALRYVTALAGVRWRLDSDGIIVVPLAHSATLESRRYYLPSSLYEGRREALGEGQGAKGLLQSVGIPFSDGASASYNPLRSELRVTIGGDGHELVEALVDALMMEEAGIELQVNVRVGMLETSSP